MLDLNHIFLFIAVVSPLAVLARAWRPGGTYRGWRIASFIVLGITAMAWLLVRDVAGYIGGGAWFALLFLPAVGLRRVADLATQHRFRAARKLATALQFVHPSEPLRHQVQLLGRLESGETAGFVPMENVPAQDRPASRLKGSRLEQSAGSPSSFDCSTYGQEAISSEGAARLRRVRRHRRLRRAPAVLVFIFLNVLAFIIELIYGGWNELGLHQLGALEPISVLYLGEYWRLITAVFLHAGPVHLLFNLFALYVLGVPLETSIGSLRFCICYLTAGIGSTAGVVMLVKLGFIRSTLLVGASGAVMGVVGAWAAFVLLHRDVPAAKQRLSNVILIIAIQIAFDLSTPQVSMSAHLCGLITGFFVGLLIAPRKMSILAS